MSRFVAAPFLRKLVALLLLLGLLVVVTLSEHTHHQIERLVVWGGSFIEQSPIAGVLVFLSFCAFSSLAVFFSAIPLIPIAIHTWGRGITFCLVALGWLLGGVLSYQIGKYPGHRLARWIFPKKEMEKYEKVLSENLGFSFVLLFQLALPSEVPGYLLGALRYRFAYYLVGLVIGEVPWALGTVYLGDSFLRRDPFWLFTIGLAGISFMASMMYFLHRRIRGTETKKTT